MSFETLHVEIKDGIGRVRLNRPEKRNAMNSLFWREVRQAFQGLSEDAALRVIVLSSTGPHFSAGLDLKEFSGLFMQLGAVPCEGRKREALRRMILTLQESFNAIEACPVPVLAAVQGGCIGGGLDMISACDVRYGTRDSYYVIKEIDLGMAADVGTLQRLPRLLPEGLVRELAYTGRRLEAEEAHARGLLTALHDSHEALLAAVEERAQSIAAKSPIAIRATKDVLDYGREHSARDGLRYVATWNAAALISDDILEAFSATQQGRTASFPTIHEGLDLGGERLG